MALWLCASVAQWLCGSVARTVAGTVASTVAEPKPDLPSMEEPPASRPAKAPRTSDIIEPGQACWSADTRPTMDFSMIQPDPKSPVVPKGGAVKRSPLWSFIEYTSFPPVTQTRPDGKGGLIAYDCVGPSLHRIRAATKGRDVFAY